MKREKEEKGYQPKTVLLDELEAGAVYELVITKLRGGAFVRYRIGDLMKCIGLENKMDQIKLPQVKYIDRVTNIIDIAGFTRITKQIIGDAIKLSKVNITDWTACKEFGEDRAYINVYFENNDNQDIAIIKREINNQLKQVDTDYRDIHTMLGYDPLIVTQIEKGSFQKYQETYQKRIDNINPKKEELDLLINI